MNQDVVPGIVIQLRFLGLYYGIIMQTLKLLSHKAILYQRVFSFYALVTTKKTVTLLKSR